MAETNTSGTVKKTLRTRLRQTRKQLKQLRDSVDEIKVFVQEIKSCHDHSDGDDSWVVYSDGSDEKRRNKVKTNVSAKKQISDAWDTVHSLWNEKEALARRVEEMESDNSNWCWDEKEQVWWEWKNDTNEWVKWVDGKVWDSDSGCWWYWKKDGGWHQNVED